MTFGFAMVSAGFDGAALATAKSSRPENGIHIEFDRPSGASRLTGNLTQPAKSGFGPRDSNTRQSGLWCLPAGKYCFLHIRIGGMKMAVDLSMTVLVVDDYNTMIRIIRNLLKQLGFEHIDDASDGSMALEKMRTKKYGLVISDWNMEPMTGYDLLKEVRADPNLSQTPFIMITAESKTENVIAAKKAGVNNYIVKPFNAATLKTKIEAVFPDTVPA
jgi:two-component system chemotaxis response regulator CheY